MRYYFAPMEGITGYVFRGAHHRYFPGVDKYFSPFIAPNQNRSFSPREKRDVLPENNEGVKLVPQILTAKAEDFMKAALDLKAMGYREVNLNLGCPSRTVVTKGRGSGFLAEPEKLERFLDEIYTKLDMKISVKTRIGRDTPDEWPKLMDLYNRFPMEELIIHPRIQLDYYKNKPNLEVFQQALAGSRNSVCYNGDIFTAGDYDAFMERFPKVEAVMLGRGLIANPWLAASIEGLCKGGGTGRCPGDGTGRCPGDGTGSWGGKGDGTGSGDGTGGGKGDGTGRCSGDGTGKEAAMDKNCLRAFHDQVYAGYETYMSGDRDVLFRMKELWFYLSCLFTNPEPYLKKIRKSSRAGEYKAVVDSLFREQELLPRAGFQPMESR